MEELLSNELKSNLGNHFEVALQTMKERCQNLQNRLTKVEEENIQYRMIHNNEDNQEDNVPKVNEVELLRDKVAELTKQKLQLTEHIEMIASENRQLWARLSKLDKSKVIEDSKITDSNVVEVVESNICLIRSKTFTQNSPNPNLRHKIDGHDEEYLSSSIGFGYLQEETNEDGAKQDFMKVCKGIHEFKKEILRQQNDLKVALSNLLKREGEKESKTFLVKSQTVDKSIETDPEIRIAHEKQYADKNQKICPMCGKIYYAATFDHFQSHVESHFVDDNAIDYNCIEKNVELISHSVGDF